MTASLLTPPDVHPTRATRPAERSDRSTSRPTQTAAVSVIIPCYNSEATIGRAVRSVAEQTWRPEEVIVVDDCSGAATVARLAELQDEYGSDWLRVVRLPENGGPSTARNKGWDLAEQPYIAFLDADDSWHPHKVEIQYGWMEAHPDVAMTGHDTAVLDRTPVSDGVPVRGNRPLVKRVGKWEQLIANRFSTPTIMLRAWLPYRFESEKKHSEDNLLWSSVVLDGRPVVKLDAQLAYLYKPRYGASGLSGDLPSMFRGQLDSCRRLWKTERISLLQAALLHAWLTAKYVRRVAIVKLRGSR